MQYCKTTQYGTIPPNIKQQCQVFIFSCPEQLNRWPCHWLTHSLSDFWFWHYRVALETCDLWDICSEWWGDLVWPQNRPTYYLVGSTYLPTYLPANLPTSLREHPQGAILDTCDNWDIWSAVMIWHLGCSLMEQSWGLVTFVTLITILTIENLD